MTLKVSTESLKRLPQRLQRFVIPAVNTAFFSSAEYGLREQNASLRINFAP